MDITCFPHRTAGASSACYSLSTSIICYEALWDKGNKNFYCSEMVVARNVYATFPAVRSNTRSGTFCRDTPVQTMV